MKKTYYLNYNYYSKLFISTVITTFLFILSIMILVKTINNTSNYNISTEYKLIYNYTSINNLKYLKYDSRYMDTIIYFILICLNTFYVLLTINIFNKDKA